MAVGDQRKAALAGALKSGLLDRDAVGTDGQVFRHVETVIVGGNGPGGLRVRVRDDDSDSRQVRRKYR